MVKGAALFLQQGNNPQSQRSLQHPHKHAGKLRFFPGNLFSVQWGRLPLLVVSRLLVFKARGIAEHRLSTRPVQSRSSFLEQVSHAPFPGSTES